MELAELKRRHQANTRQKMLGDLEIKMLNRQKRGEGKSPIKREGVNRGEKFKGEGGENVRAQVKREGLDSRRVKPFPAAELPSLWTVSRKMMARREN